jgi:hypothetical protein
MTMQSKWRMQTGSFSTLGRAIVGGQMRLAIKR